MKEPTYYITIERVHEQPKSDFHLITQLETTRLAREEINGDEAIILLRELLYMRGPRKK